jgi:hypothetical protein
MKCKTCYKCTIDTQIRVFYCGRMIYKDTSIMSAEDYCFSIIDSLHETDYVVLHTVDFCPRCKHETIKNTRILRLR